MKGFFTCLFLGWLCYGCVSSKKSIGERLKGDWELSVFPTTDKTFEEVFGQRRPRIEFDISKNAITGTTGCNHLSGSYTISDNQLRFNDNFITTKMACPGYEESVFLNAFNKVNRFDVVNGELSLWHDSVLVMTFVKK